ncbi:hypothetical protein BTW00_00515 [Psychrobacter sp. C 20.9]|uniref:hypothetical protein n=1 Tax=Psychrobacter sp. C 20.9 TaxID=1926477 RepID=UPI000946CA0C|nr:hypothetical protein [Psychrobacter sp. C 20.9]OLF38661.1 hypothetical protein BTW00_00515 [Psychrobacter sp. C 20.9]
MNNQSRYLDMLQQSINLSKEIKIPNLKWNSINYKYQNESEIREIIKIVHGELFDVIEHIFMGHPYLGNMCLDLASIAFMFLSAKGYDVEMIYGNVNINNSPEDEFDTTPESLRYEYENRINQGEQDIHAWVGLGGNIIVDFGLPDRLKKNYLYPHDILSCVGDIGFYEERLKVKYKPMLVGTDFFKTTNSYDPLSNIFGFKNN